VFGAFARCVGVVVSCGSVGSTGVGATVLGGTLRSGAMFSVSVVLVVCWIS